MAGGIIKVMATRADLVAALRKRLDAIAGDVTIDEMALPVETTPERNERVADLTRVLALAHARPALTSRLGDDGDDLWEQARADVLNGQPELAEAFTRITSASPSFSFVDSQAGNWQYGREVATVVGRPDDFAVVAPAANWIVRVIQRTDHAIGEIVDEAGERRRPRSERRWLDRIFGRE